MNKNDYFFYVILSNIAFVIVFILLYCWAMTH